MLSSQGKGGKAMLTRRYGHSSRLLGILFIVAIANAAASRGSVTVTDANIASSLAALDALLPSDPGPVAATT
jgi:hypothetical protein